jgi:hypothetical protein
MKKLEKNSECPLSGSGNMLHVVGKKAIAPIMQEVMILMKWVGIVICILLVLKSPMN